MEGRDNGSSVIRSSTDISGSVTRGRDIGRSGRRRDGALNCCTLAEGGRDIARLGMVNNSVTFG
jgi:hypothetical protein